LEARSRRICSVREHFPRDAQDAPVAQLDRAPDYESGGQEFESLRARHFGSRLFSFPQPGGLSGGGPCGHAMRNQLRELLRRAVERFEAEPASLPTTSSDLSAARAAAESFSITAGGVPAGAIRPNQTVQSKLGSKVSAMVGMFGAMRGRLAEPEASALRRPASTCGMTVEATTNAIDRRPATKSVTCGGLPW